MELHMHPTQSRPSTLSSQEALSLHPRAVLSGLLLVAHRPYPRPRQGDAQRAQTVPAIHATVHGAVASTDADQRCVRHVL
jgi:hypothetical protein